MFDFDEPENNHFLCVRELWVRGDLYHRRADIVGFVNGLPLLFIECKNIHRNLQTAFERELLRLPGHHSAPVPPQRHCPIRQRRKGQARFHHQQVGALPRVETARRGGTPAWWIWRRCSRVSVTNTTSWTWWRISFSFDESSGELKKILARNHQFLGVNRAIEAVREREARQRPAWASSGIPRGAGKSYSMVMFARKVHP